MVERSGRLGEGRTEGLGCDKVEWKARGRGSIEGLVCVKSEWMAKRRQN